MEQHLTMKKLALALCLWLLPSLAFAQCTGVFPANTLCGNLSGSPAPPAAFSASGSVVGPGSSTFDGLPIWANSLGSQLKDAATAATSIAGNYTWGGTQTYSALNTFNAQASFATSISVTGPASLNGGGSVTLGSGSLQAFQIGSANTANINELNVLNSGTSSNVNTFAEVLTSLTCANCITFLAAEGGASPIGLVGTSSGLTGGLQIQAVSGSVTVTPQLGVPSGGTGNASATAHSIPINEGVSAQANTGTGSTGQALYSNGASADPSFIDGAWQLLATSTVVSPATATSLSNTTAISANFTEYEIVLETVVPSTNNVTMSMQFQVAGVFQNTGYLSSIINGNGAAVAAQSLTTGILLGPLTSIPNNVSGIYGRYLLSNPGSTLTVCKHVHGESIVISGGAADNTIVGGCFNTSASAISGVQIIPSSGAVSGVMKIYGRRN